MVTDPIKIRIHVQGEIAEIRILMPHAMDTGLRKDERGQLLPAHFIQTFSVLHNGTPLIEGQLNTSISKNPLFGFKARNIRPGDKLAVSWVDNKGERRSDEITVTS